MARWQIMKPPRLQRVFMDCGNDTGQYPESEIRRGMKYNAQMQKNNNWGIWTKNQEWGDDRRQGKSFQNSDICLRDILSRL